MRPARPNVLFVFADQWRQQALGFTGNPDVQTPNVDAFAAESIQFTQAVSGCPVCCPYRASLMTGQRPLTHGVFLNDVPLRPHSTPLAAAFAGAGYRTANIGKWHIDGVGRSSFIPPERRLGFQYWKTNECSHDYNESPYFAGDSSEKLHWEGYDAEAQTIDACEYLGNADPEHPFFLVLSWGPPHDPYGTAPERFRRLYDPARLTIRPNVPESIEKQAREWTAGYYAHCQALDECFGRLRSALRGHNLEENTILIFASDHGDMLGSHGESKKQSPWEESVRVPFLLRYPGLAGWSPREEEAPIDAPDIMPTLLGLCGIPIPSGVEGLDYSPLLRGGEDPSDGVALLTCPHVFGEWWSRGREFRGLRTRQFTYVRDLNGPWLLYDNEADPCQMHNRVGTEEARPMVRELDALLSEKLRATGDEFLPGMEYVRKWGYTVNERETVDYKP